jgi:hypothetical protein
MYAEVERQCHEPRQPEELIDEGFRSQLPRFYELKDLLNDPLHPDAYFHTLDDFLKNRSGFETFTLWENELRGLDPVAWESLKNKASPYLTRRDKNGRGWQQLFDILCEASAYNYLRESFSSAKVSFIPESDERKTPDLEGVLGCERVLCEVKTINISDDEVSARREPTVVRNVINQLKEGFFRKLDSDIATAKSQLESYDPEGAAQHLVYIKVCFDDWVGFYKEDYLRQINQHLLKHPPGVKVVVSAGFSKAETQIVAQG